MVSDAMFNAPIPGQSLTTEPGNSPWEQPPMTVDLDEIVKFYVGNILEPRGMRVLGKALKEGIPAVQLAETMIQHSVMKGIHSIDSGMIALPVVVELLITVAELEGVKKFRLDAQLEEELEEMLDEDDLMEIVSGPIKAPAAPAVEAPVKEATGLMAKKG